MLNVLFKSLKCLSPYGFAVLIVIAVSACDARITNHPPGSNPWLDGNPGQFLEFMTAADDGPVVMLIAPDKM